MYFVSMIGKENFIFLKCLQSWIWMPVYGVCVHMHAYMYIHAHVCGPTDAHVYYSKL